MLLYENKIFSRALYHLQQGNEKLSKGLLLKMGFLTPKQLKEDWETKELFGFMPKEPSSYGHHVASSLISDLSKAAPALQQSLKYLEGSGIDQRKLSVARKSIKKTENDLRKVRMQKFSLKSDLDSLDREITSANKIMDSLDTAMKAIETDIEKADFEPAISAAVKAARKRGARLNPTQLSSFFGKKNLVEFLRYTLIGTLAVALTTVLDSLATITKYPDSSHGPFEWNDPYVVRFPELHAIVTRILNLARYESC